MADDKNPEDPKRSLQEDSIIARLKSASGGELAGLTSYVGLLGRSTKAGYWLLYPKLDMSTSLEIQESDIVHSVPLASEQSPFEGLGATRVFVRKGVQLTTTRTLSRATRAGDGDEFALDPSQGQDDRYPLPPGSPAACPCAPPSPPPGSELAGAAGPDAAPRPYVSVKNAGWFVAVFHLWYTVWEPGGPRQKYQYSGHILKEKTTSLEIPYNAGSIRVLAQEWTGSAWWDIFEYYVTPYDGIYVCFEVWGRTWAPRWRKYRCGYP